MGIEIAKVPYRDTVQAVNDLAEGRIQVMMSAIAIVRPRVQAGAIRMIAVTAAERASIYPDVPTTTEAGFPDIRIEGLTGLFGPRDMPAELRARISNDVKAAAADPTITARLLSTGQVVNLGGPAEFGAAIDAQRAQVAATGELLGIRPASNYATAINAHRWHAAAASIVHQNVAHVVCGETTK